MHSHARHTTGARPVSLNVDANHDGVMDLAFNGADRTSQVNPMVCWVNSGHTEPDSNGGLDKDLPTRIFKSPTSP